MAGITPVSLSGSTNGRGIKVGATATPGTLIHTATNDAGKVDEVFLWANNSSGATVGLTLEWGGVTNPDDYLVRLALIPANTDCFPIPIAPGLRLFAGLVVRAFAGTTNVLVIFGNVNRIDYNE